MRRVYQQLDSIRGAVFPVLLVGETGTGKEHLVRGLHDSSPRSRGPYVAINCAAIPADLLEAEMFGVARGAATGVAERRGHFRSAHGGTLFLDEIGDMPLPLQAKLLRVLEHGEVSPLGGGAHSVDVRIVSATNVALESRAAAGAFRPDLFHRVSGFTIEVPPLRRRPEDVRALLAHFCRRYAAERRVADLRFSTAAVERLLTYTWPGNVRELENEARRLVYACDDAHEVTPAMLSPRIAERERPVEVYQAADRPRQGQLSGRLAELERQVIADALDRCGGQQNRAAELLGLSRNGLAGKMKRLGIQVRRHAVMARAAEDLAS